MKRTLGILVALAFLSIVLLDCSGSDDSSAVSGGTGDDGGLEADVLADAGPACPKPTTRCGAACLELDSDNQNCGACDVRCPSTQACIHGQCKVTCASGQTVCDGRCVVLDTDLGNCGVCGNACGQGKVCSHGRCTASCDTDLVSCGDHCAATKTDPSNCGSCGHTCTGGNNAAAACEAGACTLACNDHYGNCDGNATNGCETNLNTTNTACGACGKSCGGAYVSSSLCVSGTCQIQSCYSYYGDCDQNPSNGCETYTYSVDHCGSCTPCPAHDHATPTYCYGNGNCQYSCAAGYGDCNYNMADGCEKVTSNDNANCGYCGYKCGTHQTCTNSQCLCDQGYTACTGGCADLTSDTFNCGACNNACYFANTTTPTCSGSACSSGTCNSGWDDCDANATNGCETHLANSFANCGSCGHSCASGEACVAGTCQSATACVTNATPKVLVYHAIVGNLTNELPPGSPVVVANDALWTSYTTSDFSKYDLIIISESYPYSGTDYQSAYATRNIWSPAVTGRILIDGLEGGTTANAPAPAIRTAAYKWLTSGLGTALFVSSDDGSRNLDFMANFGSFSSSASNVVTRVASPAHPVMTGVTDTALANGNYYFYYGSTITAPSTFETLLVTVNAQGTNPRIVARDVTCSPQ